MDITATIEKAARHHQAGRLEQAEVLYKTVTQSHPDHSSALHCLGMIAYQRGQYNLAAEQIAKAIAANRRIPQFHNTLGVVLAAVGKAEEAIDAYQRVIQLKPDFAMAYANLAIALKEQGRCEEAIENYEHAIRLKPDYKDAHWNRSLALLLSARISEGWKEYQRRYDDLNTINPYYSQKALWDGSSFEGKTLFVRYQQGLGDNIQFARYLPMARERGGTVIYETKKPLTNLMRPLDGIDELAEASSSGRPAASFDLHISLMDLPRVFGDTIETIPSNLPYLHADQAKARVWRWMLKRQDSPWYPTMRLFRQKSPGCWPDVFADVKKELLLLTEKQKVM